MAAKSGRMRLKASMSATQPNTSTEAATTAVITARVVDHLELDAKRSVVATSEMSRFWKGVVDLMPGGPSTP
jgi:hypothetical protein